MQKLKVSLTMRETVTTTETLRIEIEPEALIKVIELSHGDKKYEEMIAVIASLVRKG